MFDYIPRIIIGILTHFFEKKRLNETFVQKFRVWPLLDTDGVAMLAAPKYYALAGVAAWVHGHVSGFLKVALKKRWYIVNRRASFDFFRPIRVFQRFEIHTRVIAIDEFSVLRQLDFYQGSELRGRMIVQLVVLDHRYKKISATEWMGFFGMRSEDLESWPPHLEYWRGKKSC